MSRVVATVIALIAALFGAITPGLAVAAEPAAAPTFVYNDHYDTAVVAYPTTERGPPRAYDRYTTFRADDPRSLGPSARSDAATPPASYGYDQSPPLVRGATGAPAAQERDRGTRSGRSLLAIGGVAANSVRTAAPSTFTRAETLGGRGSSRGGQVRGVNAFEWLGGIAPIDVIEHQGSRIVVDGHHRLAAARRVGIDVQYRVVDPTSMIGPGRYSSIDDILQATYSVGRDNLR